jgi:FtsZ-binding cell division protein ZapB
LRKDFKVRVNNQTELLRNKNSDLENENKKIKQENTDLISENQNLKTTLEETFQSTRL